MFWLWWVNRQYNWSAACMLEAKLKNNPTQEPLIIDAVFWFGNIAQLIWMLALTGCRFEGRKKAKCKLMTEGGKMLLVCKGPLGVKWLTPWNMKPLKNALHAVFSFHKLAWIYGLLVLKTVALTYSPVSFQARRRTKTFVSVPLTQLMHVFPLLIICLR